MADAARLMMSCTMPRASKAFPKEQVELLKAEADRCIYRISCLPAVARRSMRLVGLARSVEAEYRALKAAQSALDNNDLLAHGLRGPARLPGHPSGIREPL